MANSTLSLPSGLLLFGGGVGVSMPWDTELEGHFWTSTPFDQPTFVANMSVFAVHVKKFISNAFFGFAGAGYRATKVDLKAKKATGDAAAGLQADAGTADPGAADGAVSTGPQSHFSNDIVVELGVGARVQIPTLMIGKTMIVGADLGSWYLASVLDSSPELNLELDHAFPLPITTFFGRVYAGFSF